MCGQNEDNIKLKPLTKKKTLTKNQQGEGRRDANKCSDIQVLHVVWVSMFIGMGGAYKQ